MNYLVKYYGESPELKPITGEVIEGDIVLFKANSKWYQKGIVLSVEAEHENIFGDKIKGILVSTSQDTNSEMSFQVIVESRELRQNSETIVENRNNKIHKIIES